MRVSCPNCNARYKVDDERVPPSGVTIRCPKCQTRFTATRDEATRTEAPFDPDGTRREDMPVPLPGQEHAVALPSGASKVESTVFDQPGEAFDPNHSEAFTQIAAAPTEREPGRRRHDPMIPPSTYLQMDEDPSNITDGLGDLDLDASLGEARNSGAFQPVVVSNSELPDIEDPSVLDFIDDTRDRADLKPREVRQSELRIRHGNGQVEGPFGHGHIAAMLRNREIRGTEEVSEDGINWRPIAKEAAFQEALAKAIPPRAASVAFQQVLLPADEGPLSLELEEPTPPAQARSAQPLDPADLNLSAAIASSMRSSADLLGSDDPGGASLGFRGSSDLERDLELADVPKRGQALLRHKKSILAAGALVLVGGLAWLAFGFFTGGQAASDAASKPSTPAAVPAPVAKALAEKAKAAAAEAAIRPEDRLREGSYASLEALIQNQKNAEDPAGLLLLASAEAKAGLRYGAKAFPPDALKSHLDRLKAVDPSQLLGGDTQKRDLALAKLEASWLLISQADAAALQKMSQKLKRYASDPDLQVLLGQSEATQSRPNTAAKAFDQALVLNIQEGPAMAGFGRLAAEQGDKHTAAIWLDRANQVDPFNLPVGLEAAKLYTELNIPGKAREIRLRMMPRVARGLLPQDRALALFETAKAFDAIGKLDLAKEAAIEANQLAPADPAIAQLAGLAWAASGDKDKAYGLLDPLVAAGSDRNALFAKLRAALSLSDLAAATLALDTAKDTYPKDYRSHLWDGILKHQLGHRDEARLAFKRAIRLAPKDPTPALVAGQRELGVGAVELAMENAEIAARIDPKNFSVQLLLADTYLARNQLKEARQHYESALEMAPSSVEVGLGLAGTLIQEAELQSVPEKRQLIAAKATPILLRTLTRAPDNAALLFLYGRLLAVQERPEAAFRLYEVAAEANPKAVEPHLRLVASALSFDPPRLETAEKAIKAAKEAELNLGQSTARVPYWEGRVHLAQGKPEQAVSDFSRAVEDNPNEAEYQYWLGEAHLRNNGLYEALAAYEKALRLNSRMGEALRAMGHAELDRHQFKAARSYFARYRKAVPQDATILLDIGDSYNRQNQDAKAESAYRELIRRLPKHAKAHLQIGLIALRRGQLKAAEKALKTASQLDSNLGEAWCQLGLLQWDHPRQKKEATASLEHCVKLPGSPQDLAAAAQERLSEH